MNLNLRLIVASSLFTALVFVATTIFPVYIPATQGYFNFGETMIYASALTLGPIVGAFSGGIGSMLADVVISPVYAPGTLVIKSVEGFVVGLLGEKLRKLAKNTWRIYTASGGVIGGLLITFIGVNFYTGETLIGPGGAIPSITVWIPEFFWPIIGVSFLTLTVYLGYKKDPATFGELLATVIGGSIMITGYYIYEVTLLTLGIIPLEVSGAAYLVALVEVPFNVMQVLVGVLIGIPIAKKLRATIKTF